MRFQFAMHSTNQLPRLVAARVAKNRFIKMQRLTPLVAVGNSIKAPSKVCNQDHFLIDKSCRFAIIADGMGGHRGGEVASRVAIDSLSSYLNEMYESSASNDILLQEGFKKAHEAVLASKSMDLALDAMGTTLLALLLRCTTHSEDCTFANVGDSRLYLAHGETLSLETVDDTIVQKAVNEGKLAPSQVSKHPLRHVLTQCIGQNEGEPRATMRHLRIDEGDVIILCTDGLHECLDMASINEVIKSSRRDETHVGSISGKILKSLLSIAPTDDATAVVGEFKTTQTTLRER